MNYLAGKHWKDYKDNKAKQNAHRAMMKMGV